MDNLMEFGAGLTIDDLIGWIAWDIHTRKLPSGDIFQSLKKAARIMVEAGLGGFMLMELWGDGHSVWQHPKEDHPVVVTANGQIIHTN